MKKLLLISFFVASSLHITAQKETYNWYFGYNAGMDFNNTTSINHPTFGKIDDVPTSVVGPIWTAEGCFSISGKDGSLLLASDGITVYNRKKVKMAPTTHVLKGHPSATQSGVVIPYPGTIGKYFIVSMPYEGNRPRPGMFYTTVDLGLNDGDGMLTEMNKQISLGTTGMTNADVPENLTVVGNTNGRDYWLVSRMRNKFVVWAVTSEGISTKPTGYTVNKDLNVGNQGMGSIKFSPDGTKVVHGDYTAGNLSYADFDPATGIITNQRSVQSNIGKLYGVEFSTNGKYLYLTCIQNSANMAQNGLYILPVANLPTSGTTITLTQRLPDISNVQLGKGNRIYCISQYKRNSMWIILNPDEGGTKIAEITNFFWLRTSGDANKGLPWLGLPPFVTSFFKVEKIAGNKFPCILNTESYTIQMFQGSGLYQVAYMIWDFGDGSPKVRQDYVNGTIQYTQSHKFNEVKQNTVTITPYRANGTAISDEIIIDEVYVRYCNLIINSATTHTLIKR